MSESTNAKTLGGIGALLIFIGIFVPSFGMILAIVGFILTLVAVKHISEELNDHPIFTNFLYAFILEIIGFALAFVIILVTLQSVGGISYLMELQTMAYSQPAEILDYLMPFITGAIVGFIALCVFMIISAIFLKKSYDKIAEHTHVKWFSTTGLLMLIGAATMIIFIGLIIIFVALLFQIIAFFSLPEKLTKK